MGRFKNCVAGDVINISSRGDPDPAHLRGQRVAKVIAVQIECGDHVEIFRTQEHLLKCDVGNRVFNHDSRARFSHRNLAPGTAINFLRAKIFLCNFKPQSRNAPSVNFMMLPLCTRVTLLRWFVIAYVIALWIKRTLPERLTGLMPIPTQTSSLSGAPTIFQNSPAFSFVPKRILSNCFGNSFCRKLRIFCASGVPAAYSIPA